MIASLLRRALAPALLAGAAAAPAAAQTPTPTPAPLFIDTVKVNIVNVEVFVRDKDGKPVVGLTPADFEVFEDGKPVAITNFYAATSPAAPMPVAEATPAPTPIATPVPERQRLSLVYFIDNAGISPAQRGMAFANLEKMIHRSMQLSGTRAMLVTGGNRVVVRQSFTEDESTLLAALGEAQKEVGQGAALTVDRQMVLRLLNQTAPPETSGGTGGGGPPGSRFLQSQFAVEDMQSILEQIRRVAESEYERTRWILEALENFVDSFSGLEGRKVIFFVGGDISMRPGQGLLERWEARFGHTSVGQGFNAVSEASQYNVAPYFDELVQHANANGVTFYSIDAMGNRGLSTITAETKELYDANIVAGEAMSTQQSLLTLAGATGGQLAVNNPDMSAQIDSTVEDLTTYYSLGYAAPHEGDGKYHRITVNVDRPDVKLRHREGYLDRPSDERMVDRSVSALLFGAASNPLGVGLSVRAQVKQPDGNYLVTILVTVPLSELALLPQGQVQEGTLSMWLAAKTAGGERVNEAPKLTFPVRIPNERLLTALGQSIGYTYQLRMDEGEKKIAVCLRDDLAQTNGTATLTFIVGDQADAATRSE